jgi:hypothetical protein
MLAKGKGGPAFLTTVRSLAKSVMAEARNPKWTSYGALEIDVFARYPGDFALFVAAVEPLARVEFSRDLSVAPPHKAKKELVEEAREYFNSERFWEAHEALETAWRNAQGGEKRFLQGLILVCAALVHHQKREEEVALGVLHRAAAQLSYGTDPYFGISVDGLRTQVQKILSRGKLEVFSI